jgi:hypothetical protein
MSIDGTVVPPSPLGSGKIRGRNRLLGQIVGIFAILLARNCAALADPHLPPGARPAVVRASLHGHQLPAQRGSERLAVGAARAAGRTIADARAIGRIHGDAAEQMRRAPSFRRKCGCDSHLRRWRESRLRELRRGPVRAAHGVRLFRHVPPGAPAPGASGGGRRGAGSGGRSMRDGGLHVWTCGGYLPQFAADSMVRTSTRPGRWRA